jgi:hypothetical protein
MEKSLINMCEQIIRDLANDISSRISDKPFREKVIKLLKFSNINDWYVLCSLMDVLGDTELAKENYIRYDLTGPTKILDYGEQYLRLYGILNAVYLQKSAIVSFIELVKLDGKKEIVKKIDGLKLLELRHILGAHTVNFLDNGIINPHQFQRRMLTENTIKTLDSKGNFKDYNLKELLKEYNSLAEDLLIQATEKFINTVLKNGGKKKEKYIVQLDDIKAAKKGDILVFSPEGDVTLRISIISSNQFTSS